ncbi:DNA polymerase IV [Paenibacillus aurantius]|uniref:DNA polymerase IV n=1 Tax=Paenibacillus aurantius TaxID=2918900 RepID=A0AA96RI85_9BACL|nr:DNA polymerase IV [Paenibacillus aurantius]WNQ11924.1 DNA polymerase IV [Paenibacillus aurantius]
MDVKNRIIGIADMQSFYVSVEKAKHPEYRNKPAVVAGDPERRSGIILAACPIAKRFGVTTAEPLWAALQKCPDLVILRPHMQLYIDVSLEITEIIERYTDQVEPYSCDEIFFDVTGSLKRFGPPLEIAAAIQRDINSSTGIYARVCLAENKVMSKVGLDIIAKKEPGGLFHMTREDWVKRIYPVPVRDMWMIGSRMNKHLNRMGIYTIGDLARSPLPRLTKRWGVNGEVIYRIANGLDDSPVSPDTHTNGQSAIGNGMVLPRDYREAGEIEVVLYELCSQVCRRARQKRVMGQVVSVGVQGADWDNPTGFSRQKKIEDPTNLSSEMFKAVKELFHRHWDGLPVRRVSVNLSQLSDDSIVQLSFFQDNEKQLRIEQTMDRIKDRFGDMAVLRASSLTAAGQAKDRAAKIGGHYK